ncbi:MAG: hypothetical protein PHO26_08240 [Dehalococcoidia bacterium]|nr:hypothetical protein [Dehalococcoidia bacterium]MDD5494561.1 hypothetical protein [Dehalococcoidia bacterium]
MKKSSSFIIVGILLATLIAAAAYRCGTLTSQQDQQPVEIMSVSGPLAPINPGGPVVEVTLKNVSSEPVVSLTATLNAGSYFGFAFDVSAANPLMRGKSISSRVTMIGGGFDDTLLYPLTVNGTLKSGGKFNFTKQVKIQAP